MPKAEQIKFLTDLIGHQGDECVKWPFTIDSHVGRGRVYYDDRNWWAHRLMCIMAHGEPPEERYHASHTCGKGHEACVNPKHLEWKTGSANTLEKHKHGTFVQNTWGRRGKLTLAQAREIKALKGIKTQVELAKEYNISDTTIRGIHAGRWWKQA